MLGNTHKIAGLCAGFWITDLLEISIFQNPYEYCGIIAASVLGSLLPDADMPNSTIGRELYVAFLPIYLIRSLSRFLSLFIKKASTVSRSLSHRGLSHSPLLWIIILFALKAVPWLNIHMPWLAASLVTGAFTHLILDYFTGGIPLFAPFSLKRIKPPFSFKTGGYFEFLTQGVLITSILIHFGLRISISLFQ